MAVSARRGIASIYDADGFDQQRLHLAVGGWAVLNTARNDEHLARTECDVTVAKLDCEFADDHEDEFVGVRVVVP